MLNTAIQATCVPFCVSSSYNEENKQTSNSQRHVIIIIIIKKPNTNICEKVPLTPKSNLFLFSCCKYWYSFIAIISFFFLSVCFEPLCKISDHEFNFNYSLNEYKHLDCYISPWYGFIAC